MVNPVDFDFTFAIASKKIVPPSQLATALAQVELGDAANVAVIVGAVAENSVHASAIRQAAADFASAKNARLCRIPQGANALGLSQHGVLPASRDAQSMLRDARSAYVNYGIEPGLDFADQHAALKAAAASEGESSTRSSPPSGSKLRGRLTTSSVSPGSVKTPLVP